MEYVFTTRHDQCCSWLWSFGTGSAAVGFASPRVAEVASLVAVEPKRTGRAFTFGLREYGVPGKIPQPAVDYARPMTRTPITALRFTNA